MYIGVRSSKCLPEEDNYWGSSKYLPEDVSETFDKFILGRFDTREEAVADEIHRHNINDVAKNPLFINKSKQTSIRFDTSGVKFPNKKKLSEKTRKRMSDAHKNKPSPAKGCKWSEDKKAKHSELLKKISFWKGKEIPEETKKKISNTLTGRTKETHKYLIRSNKTKNLQRANAITRWVNIDKSEYTYICEHCGKEVMLKTNYKRWHGDNCKSKGEIV